MWDEGLRLFRTLDSLDQIGEVLMLRFLFHLLILFFFGQEPVHDGSNLELDLLRLRAV